MANVIEIGGNKFNADYLKSIPEDTAVKAYKHIERSKVVNAWKQANGKSVRNYATSKPEAKAEKPKAKKTAKKSNSKKTDKKADSEKND